MKFINVHFEWVEADSVLVGKAGEESTDELDWLDDEENDAKDCINLSDSGLPEGEICCQVLGGHS